MAQQIPLSIFPLIPSIPVSSSVLSSSEVSSLLDKGLDFYIAFSLEINNRLDAFRKGGSKEHDRAASILGAFLEHLSKAGRWQLAKDIKSIPVDDEATLLQLAQYLTDAILKPCMLSSI